MKELYVFCEGETEQGFCKQVLLPHLFPQHEGQIHTLLIAHSKHHGVIHTGGIGKYVTLRRQMISELKRHKRGDVFFTTMIDLYQLPRDFPGKRVQKLDPSHPTRYVTALEAAFERNINHNRFIAYLQLYEYETLLFADAEAFLFSFTNCDDAIEELKSIVASVPSIEHIDEGEQTAPSKRIIALLPKYKGLKSRAGPDIAEFIGLDVMRAKSPHFGAWLSRLEAL